MTTMALKSTWRSAMGLTAAAMIVACGVAGFAPAMAMQPADKTNEKLDYSKAEKRDSIIFNNGNKVEGIIIEETDASVKFLVIVGTLRSEATYNKADILDIKRNEFAPAAKDEKKDEKKEETKPEMAAAATPTDDLTIVDRDGKAIPPGTTKIYVVEFGGEFGRDISKTPMKLLVDDIARIQPEVLIVRFNHDRFVQDGQEIDFMHEGSEGQVYQQLETAGELDTLLGNRIRDDPAFKVKPRQVAWIRTALGGGAFMPFVFPEIYFTSDGYHGGIGGLDFLFKGVGSEVAQRKQQSLRLARAIGLAEKGGHDKRIMRAMTWSAYVLSYQIVGGQVKYLEDKMPEGPEWFLLKDDGIVEESHRDTAADRVRMKGNDLLTLDAKTAFDIGFSKGTADNLDELLSKMGITRNYAIVKNKGGQILRAWHVDVIKAEGDMRKLIRDYQGVEVKAPGQYEQRTAARGQRKGYLRQMQSIVEKYRESLDPRNMGTPDADQFLNQLDVLISQIDTAQKLDRRP